MVLQMESYYIFLSMNRGVMVNQVYTTNIETLIATTLSESIQTCAQTCLTVNLVGFVPLH